MRRKSHIGQKTVNRPSQSDQEFIKYTTSDGTDELRRNIAFSGKRGTGTYKREKMKTSANTIMSASAPVTKHTKLIDELEEKGVRVDSLAIKDEDIPPTDSNVDRLTTILENRQAFEGVSQQEAKGVLSTKLESDRYQSGHYNDIDTGNSLATLRSMGIIETDGRGSAITLTTYGDSLIAGADGDRDILSKGILYAASRRPEVGAEAEDREEAWKNGAWSDDTFQRRMDTTESLRQQAIDAGIEPRDSTVQEVRRVKQGSRDSRTPAQMMADNGLNVTDFMTGDQYKQYKELGDLEKEAKEDGDRALAKDLKTRKRELLDSVRESMESS